MRTVANPPVAAVAGPIVAMPPRSLAEFPICSPGDTISTMSPPHPPIQVNRAPILILWVMVVTERHRYPLQAHVS